MFIVKATSLFRAIQIELIKEIRSGSYQMYFHSRHKGHFGTINGFRLGRLPSVPVRELKARPYCWQS